MKKCNTELMKEIKKLEERKDELLKFEREQCKVTYINKESKIDNNYDYESINNEIDSIDLEIRKIKKILAYSNATTIVPEYNMTIGECIIFLAQLNNKKNKLQLMANAVKIKRISSTYNTKVEYEEILYDINKVKDDFNKVVDEINKLQMAIDRCNLCNLIEI